mgnify:CR=1 FL=1|nr:MAG TPA: ParB protein [Caudoviricetes sp.]
MNVKNVLLSRIVPYAKNAKKHDKKQIANVAESIKQYGFVQPIVIDRWEKFTGKKEVLLNDD